MRRVEIALFVIIFPFTVGMTSHGEEIDLTRVPRWLAESETYGFHVGNLEEVRGTSWKFITHCPRSKEFLCESRRRGIRAFPYMTFYQAPLTTTYYEFRLADHPDWILVDQQGRWVRAAYWEPEDGKNLYSICPNTKGYTDALLSYLEELMRRGAGGIFLDNIRCEKQCYGPQFGKHVHLHDTQIEAFADLLRRAKGVIRRYDPEGALLVNSANPPGLPKQFWPWADADMSEAFICTWVTDRRVGNWGRDWHGMDKKIPAGKQVCALSYVGHTTNPVKDDLYFTYASARLMNFVWNAGGDSHVARNADLDLLYSLTLGQPTDTEKEHDGVYHRRFAGGVIAVNPTDSDKTVELNGGLDVSFLRDLYRQKDVAISNQKVLLEVPAQSGRVWIHKPSTAADFTEDCHTLVVRTEPALGKTWFELDGVPVVTHSGSWQIKYKKGRNYGAFQAGFPEAGSHTLRVRDLTRKGILIPNSYVEAYSLNDNRQPGEADSQLPSETTPGKIMDPTDPTVPPSGKIYRFAGWKGAVESDEETIVVHVDGTTTVIAEYVRE